MNKLKPIIGIALIFTFGVMAGVIGTRVYFKHKFEQMPEPLTYHKQIALKRMDSNLNLSPAQFQAIAAIMDESETRIIQIMAPHAREIDQIMTSTQARIMAELDEEQQQKFAEHINRIRQLRREHMRIRFRMQMGPMGMGMPPMPRPFEEGPPPGMHDGPVEDH